MLFIASLQTYSNQNKSKIKELEERLKETEDELITKKQEIVSLNKEIKQKSDNVNGLIENLTNVKDERDEALSDIRILEAQITMYVFILESMPPELRQQIVRENTDKLLDITAAIENQESKGLDE